VLFLDLDRFRIADDSLGHAAGNTLLCKGARRLQQAVRAGDLVARLGGDEFAVPLEPVPDTAAVQALAQRLLQALSARVRIGRTDVTPGASIGITIDERGCASADEVLRDADPSLVAHVGEVLQRHGPPPTGLTLEITETTLMGSLDVALDLGRSLGKKVIAEGIESAAQLAALHQLGVPVGQGCLLSRPLTAQQVGAMLAEARGRAPQSAG
jgi:diguanylate cyclase (GGDEF)-like protein